MPKSFLAELKRRNVFKVATGYVILAWLVLQVGDVVVPILELPGWTLKLLLFIGVVGFPFALFFAWVYELTPEGIKKDSDISPEESVTLDTGHKLNIIISILLVIAISYIFYQHQLSTQEGSLVERSQPPGADEKVDEPGGTSIAVLPFVNMSPDPEQEYFSDGIAEQILNSLAKTPKLLVTSRSSAFAFKGKKVNITEVAQKLRVQNILEGSVQKSGNTLRISAQLIEAQTDKQLWSETYDRELTEVFAIQDEISAAIVSALKTKLGVVDAVTINTDEVDIDAYNEYLKGKFFLEKRTESDLKTSLIHFDKALNSNPAYALAYTGKASATLYLSERLYGNASHQLAVDDARVYAERALELNPGLAAVQFIMGQVESFDSDDFEYSLAKQYLQRAIEINPNYAEAYRRYALIDAEKALEFRRRAVELDPMDIDINYSYARLLVAQDQFNQAWQVALHMLNIEPKSHQAYEVMGVISFEEGKIAESIRYYENRREFNPTERNNAVVASAMLEVGLTDKSLQLYRSHKDSMVFASFYGQEFEEHYREAQLVFPRDDLDAFGFHMLGRAALYTGNYSDCIKNYERELDINPDPNHLNYNLIHCYRELDNEAKVKEFLAKEEEIFERFSGQVEDSEDYQYQLFQVSLIKGQVDVAIKSLKRALELDDERFLFWDEKTNPRFKDLRAHPLWPEIVKMISERATQIRNEYLALSELDINTVIANHVSTDARVNEYIQVDAEILQDYVGTYYINSEMHFIVTVENGELYVQRSGGMKVKSRAIAEDTFVPLTFNITTSFSRDENGKVTSFNLHWDPNKVKIPKVED